MKPGWHVIDIFSAGGYNTELLSRIVGPKGEVIAYNNPAYAGFSAKEIAARYAGNRLSNVRQLTAEVDALTLEPRESRRRDFRDVLSRSVLASGRMEAGPRPTRS